MYARLTFTEMHTVSFDVEVDSLEEAQELAGWMDCNPEWQDRNIIKPMAESGHYYYNASPLPEDTDPDSLDYDKRAVKHLLAELSGE